MRLPLLAIAAAVLSPCLAAHASLIGDNIHVTWNDPNEGTVALDLGSLTVSGSSISSTLGVTVAVTGNQIIFTELPTTTNYPSDPFDGYILTDTSGNPGINGVTWDPSSNLGSGIATSFTSNSVMLNFGGVGMTSGQKVVFDLSFAPAPAPEPSSLLLLGTGLLGLAGAAKRRLLA